MACAEEPQRRRRWTRLLTESSSESLAIALRMAFEPDFDRAAAALAERRPEREPVHAQGFGARLLQHSACDLDRLPFKVAAAYRSIDPARAVDAARADQHARAGLARCRATHCGDDYAHDRGFGLQSSNEHGEPVDHAAACITETARSTDSGVAGAASASAAPVP